MKNVIMTGATSMLGIALTQELLGKGTRVTALIRPNSAKKNALPKHELLRVIEVALEDTGKTNLIEKNDYDVFYHLGWTDTDKAGRNSARSQERNIGYTLDCVKKARELGCRKFVGTGSQAEYGRKENTISESEPVAPETAYGAAKYSAGKLSAIYAAELGIEHVWTRVFSVYGPNDSQSTMLMYCINKFLKKEKPSFTKCAQMWDYLYCADAADALCRAGEKGRNMAVYNIGSGTVRPLSDYVNAVRDAIDPSLTAGIGELPYAGGQVMYLCADISALKRDTGFEPRTDFRTGIANTIKWAKENIK